MNILTATQETSYALHPIGVVHSDYTMPFDPKTHKPLYERHAVIEVFPQYRKGLLHIGENSHLWVLCFFHKAKRDQLVKKPAGLNPDLPEYGVFSFRFPIRPNPVALTLVQLKKVEDGCLYVQGLDAIADTPVIDIKPYSNGDIRFSSANPHIRPSERKMREEFFFADAFFHHQERCAGVETAVRMAMAAEDRLGSVSLPDVRVEVTGSACLADGIQGITRARFGNPPRFSFCPAQNLNQTIWRKGNSKLRLTVKKGINISRIMDLDEKELLIIDKG